jgi:hypothetical protein
MKKEAKSVGDLRDLFQEVGIHLCYGRLSEPWVRRQLKTDGIVVRNKAVPTRADKQRGCGQSSQ